MTGMYYTVHSVLNNPVKRKETETAVPVRMLWKAVSTFVESRAEVSIKLRLFCSAKDLASSVGTALRCLRSDLFPTSMMTMLESAWSRSSRSHLSTFS